MKKKLLSLAMALLLSLSLLPLSSLAAGTSFVDVAPGQWYYDDVRQAVASGLVNGKTARTFCPNDNLTYAEAVKLAACMNQKYTTGAVTLQNGTPWYQSYVDYARANRIITRNYNWNAMATRAGYMEIFAKALPQAALVQKNTIVNGSILDVPNGHPQEQAIYQLYRAGIVQGSDALHNCKPDDPIKRSEVAAILTRMMDSSKRLTFTMTGQAPTGLDAQTSLSVLRQYTAADNAVFAVAYLGYLSDPMQIPMRDWLAANFPRLTARYPFLKEIPDSRVVGSEIGELYCLVPLDPTDIVDVSAVVHLPYGDWDVGEVIYYSDRGDPFILCCNGGQDVPDARLGLTKRGGEGLMTWYPMLDDNLVSLPSREDGTVLGLDFTDLDELYENMIRAFRAYDWAGPSAAALGDTQWTYQGYDLLRPDTMQNHFLDLRANGQAELSWLYEGDKSYREHYTGRWSLVTERGLTCLKLDLTSQNGTVIHDRYPAMLAEDGIRMVVGVGLNNTQLPFQAVPYTLTLFGQSYG